MCFEPKNDFVENIKRELEIDENVAGQIAEEVNKNIFSKVSDEINSMWQIESTESAGDTEQSEGKETQSQSGVGNSFEQIILNQARAMQPAREAPINLPTGEQKQNEPVKTPDYSSGNDPYREPAG